MKRQEIAGISIRGWNVSVIFDFQGFHARHLAVFRQYARFRRESFEPIRQASAKIAVIKSNTRGVSRAIAEKKNFLAPEFIGRRVDLTA